MSARRGGATAAVLYRSVTESAWRDTVIEIAHTYSWKVFCVRQSSFQGVSAVMADSIGFPDLLLLHQKRRLMVVAELKREGQSPTAAQWDWLRAFANLNTRKVRWTWWQPSDVDRVHELLGD